MGLEARIRLEARRKVIRQDYEKKLWQANALLREAVLDYDDKREKAWADYQSEKSINPD